MFAKKNKPNPLDDAITSVFSEMAGFTSDSDEYREMSLQLERLYTIKELERANRRVSPDTMATIGANLLGIAIIVGHERAHVITSKAINFIMKAR